MDLAKLNEIAGGGFLPTKKISELTKGTNLMVTKLKLVNTKYGRRAVAELDDEFQVFLPKKVSEALTGDEIFFNDLLDAVNKYEFFLSTMASSIEFSGK